MLGAFSGVSFDAATNVYTVTYSQSPDGPGGSSAPNATRTLTYTPAQITSTNGNFTTFQHPDPDDPSQTDRLRVSKSGSANSAVALSYTSFAIQEIGNGTTFLQRDYIVFGARTPSVPTTGTASYSGIVEGTYNRPTAAQTYLISGTASLTADFAAATVGTTLNFSGTNVIIGQPGLSAQTFAGNGNITSGGNSQFSGHFTGMGLPGTGLFVGNFYGNSAEEFGYGFIYSGPSDQITGVAVGKR